MGGRGAQGRFATPVALLTITVAKVAAPCRYQFLNGVA